MFEDQENDLPLNTIELDIERQRQVEGEAGDRLSGFGEGSNTRETKTAEEKQNQSDNTVESDEVFKTSKAEVKPIVPSDIEQRYLRVGYKFYHPKNNSLLAFEDKGNKLETKSSSETIVESMVLIAEARGWEEIKVSGSDVFRKEVWLEATLRGMHVKGYSPSEKDKAELEKRALETATNKVEKNNQYYRANDSGNSKTAENRANSPSSSPAPTSSKVREEKNIAPILVAFGAAKYLHDEKKNDSFFVTTMDDKGTETTSWGVGLQRAMKESGAQVGDRVTIIKGEQERVTITEPVRDKNQKIIDHKTKEVMRNKWHVKMAEAFVRETPTEAVRLHPELAGAVGAVTAMEKQAEADGLTHEQRAIVKARVHQNVTNSIERGNIPKMNIKENFEVKREREDEMGLAR